MLKHTDGHHKHRTTREKNTQCHNAQRYRQTDGRTDGVAVRSTKKAVAEDRSRVITSQVTGVQ